MIITSTIKIIQVLGIFCMTVNIFFCFGKVNIQKEKINLHASSDALVQLCEAKITNMSKPVKLHLGCGENHLQDYINIDFPPSEHTVQSKSGADAFGDITKLRFPANSVSEIRSHHVFEHFNRTTALAMLCAWHIWLKIGGIIYIETPDFQKSIEMILDTQYSYPQKQIILRHIFGSHEAPWAIHCDGWYRAKYEHILNLLGFKISNIKYSSYLLTHNITIIAQKELAFDTATLITKAYSILMDSLVDKTEETMFGVWCKNFDAALNRLILT